jgi:uncharacterized membrane protein
MTNRQTVITVITLLALAVAISVLAWPRLPESVPVHWGLDGRPDRWGSREEGAFAMLGVLAFLVLLFAAIPKIAPRASIEAFRPTYNVLYVCVLGFMVFVHALMLANGLGLKMDVATLIIAGTCLLFGLIGNLLGKVRPNYFVGIRTPWTLTSEAVWVETHRRGARLAVASSLAGLVLLAVGVHPMIAVLVATLGLIWPAIDSYLIYRRLEREGRLD